MSNSNFPPCRSPVKILICILNTWFRASWFNVNKGPTRCNSMQTFILCHVTLYVSGVMHPSSGVLKTVSATSGVRHGNGTVTSFLRIRPRRKKGTVPLPWRTPEAADAVFSTPDDGCMIPETCRVRWQRINVYILLHRVGPLLTLVWSIYHYKIKWEIYDHKCMSVFMWSTLYSLHFL